LWELLMQLQNTDEITNASPIRPGFSQPAQEHIVEWWPDFPPAPNRLRKVKRARLLEKQGQIVQRVKHILLAGIRAGMAGQQLAFIPNLNVERIRLGVTVLRAWLTGTL